jgi:hypothetical protein
MGIMTSQGARSTPASSMMNETINAMLNNAVVFRLCCPCPPDCATASAPCHDQNCCCLWSMLINLCPLGVERETFVHYNSA